MYRSVIRAATVFTAAILAAAAAVAPAMAAAPLPVAAPHDLPTIIHNLTVWIVGILAGVATGFVLAIIAAGVTVMTRETLQVRYGVRELAPRLVIAFVAANLSGPIVRGLISGANALTTGLTGDGIAQSAAFGQLARTVAASLTDPSAA